MPRAPRPIADGLLYHALNRGNNRAPVFFAGPDYLTFLKGPGQTQRRYPFQLFGYCLMSNHFHLLLAPQSGQSISRILQSLTVAHTWHYHRHHGTSGHIWQGRFRSPVIQDDAHALVVLRYIEGNPWRAKMVADLASYPWSSYRVHGMGAEDPLLSPLPVWETLGPTEEQRRAYWRSWVHTPLTASELERLRRSVVSGRPYGAPAWCASMGASLALRGEPRPRGRPKKHV